MSERRTKGALQVTGMSATELNLVLREIQERLDKLEGLRGRTEIFDRVEVGQATEPTDALTLQGGTEPATLTAEWTWKGKAIRITDANDQLIHSFGTDV